MTSILKADDIQDSSGNNIINEAGDVITIGASGDTITIPSGATFNINGTAGTGVGITEADMWRLTSDLSLSGGGTTALTANLERSDTYGSGQIGTGMSESSGVFTFPSTGIWQLTAVGSFYGGLDIDYIRVNISVTTNNSDYNTASTAINHTHNGFYGVTYNEHLFDVTSTTNCKVKFIAVHENSGTLKGDTGENFSFFKFIRLGDT